MPPADNLGLLVKETGRLFEANPCVAKPEIFSHKTVGEEHPFYAEYPDQSSLFLQGDGHIFRFRTDPVSKS